MQTFFQTLVLIAQLAAGGFVMWGGWLCYSARARESEREPKADSFERVASLVLLALLCTTLAALG